MEENEDLKENNRNVLNNTGINNVSNNEDCLFISIVTESDEETITLRRNIGTDPEVSYDVNSETVSETVINITKQDSFENVQSQTIFILGKKVIDIILFSIYKNITIHLAFTLALYFYVIQ